MIIRSRQHYLSVLLGLCFCTITLSGQNKKLDKASEYYDHGLYADAIPLFEQGLKKKDYAGAKAKLAFCYKAINDIDKSEKLYKEVYDSGKANKKALISYGEVLLNKEKYEEARKIFLAYLEKKPDDELVALLSTSAKLAPGIQPHFPDIKVKAFTQNGPTDDGSPVLFDQGIVFTSDRTQGMKLVKQKSGATGRDYIRLYYASRNLDGTYEPAQPFDNKINEFNRNTGPISFSSDGEYAVFAKNDVEPNKKNEYPMQLYGAVLENGKWKNIEKLDFCRNSSNYMNPSLSPDGNSLYFSSPKGGGVGGLDLWVSERVDNKWAKPQNLGRIVNTVAHEAYPFVDQSGRLYFCSKGHPGLGGYDLFYTEKDDSGRWQIPVNLGKPINSSLDDISIFLFDDQQSGMITSGRDGGDDDIFFFGSFDEEEMEFALISEAGDPLKEEEISNEESSENIELPDEDSEEMVSLEKKYEETAEALEEALVEEDTNQEIGSETIASTTQDVEDLEVSDNDPEKLVSPINDSEQGLPTSLDLQKEEQESFDQEEPMVNIEQEEQNINVLDADTDKPQPELEEQVLTEEWANEEEYENTLVATGVKETLEPTQGVSDISENESPIAHSTEQVKEEFGEEEFWEGEEESTEPIETEVLNQLPPDAPETSTRTEEDGLTSTNKLLLSNRRVVEAPVSETDIEPIPRKPDPFEPELIEPSGVPNFDKQESPGVSSTGDLLEFETALNNDQAYVGQSLIVTDIKFAFDQFSFELTEGHKASLMGVLNLLKKHSNLKVEIGAYTESFGEDRVNKTLSRYRANSVKEFLLAEGIAESRLNTRGYGEEKLLNHCKNGVLCTRDQHLENQRIALKIIGL